MNFRPVFSMAPHSGVGGAGPRPRKLRPLAVRIAVAIRRLVWTINGAVMLGKMWLSISRVAPAPEARAARMYSWLRTASVEARANRANDGSETAATAMIR